jgi:hypothetical protein
MTELWETEQSPLQTLNSNYAMVVVPSSPSNAGGICFRGYSVCPGLGRRELVNGAITTPTLASELNCILDGGLICPRNCPETARPEILSPKSVDLCKNGHRSSPRGVTFACPFRQNKSKQ